MLESASFSDLQLNVKPSPQTLLQEMHRLDGSKVSKPVYTATSLDSEGWTLGAPVPGFEVRKTVRRPMAPGVARTALDAAAVRGTVLVCGAPPPGTEIPVDIQGILTGKVLRGVTMGDTEPRELIPRLVALHAQGRLPLEKLERRYALDDIQSAVDDMHSGATVKPVIVY